MIKLNIISNKKDTEYITEIFKDNLMKNFKDKKIEDFFNFKEDYILNIYLDTKEWLDCYVLNNSKSYKNEVPKWVSGFTNEECVYLVYPNESNFDEMIKTAIHEIVHLMSYNLKVNGKRIKLLEEGLAYYLANQMTVGRFKKLREEYLSENKKLLRELINYSSEEFASNNGYFYGFFFIKFLKNRYSNSKIISYITNPNFFLKDLEKLQVQFDEFMISEFGRYN